MANYRGHVYGGAFFAILYLMLISIVFAIDILPDDREYFSGYAFPVSLVGITILFGMLPDIDINSHAQNLFYMIFFVLDAWLIYNGHFQQAAYLGLVAMLPIISKHRGWTHWRYSAIIVPLPLLILPALATDSIQTGLPYYGAAVTGYFSHLFFDKLLFKRKRA